MWFFRAPAAVLGLAAIASLPSVCAKPYPAHLEEMRELHNASQIEKRDCLSGETSCGWDGWLCCTSGQVCTTDANDQAQCVAAAAQATGWAYYTTTWVETAGLVTRTSVYSSYIGAATTAICSNVQSPCGANCCDSGFYCNVDKTCAIIAGGSSGGIVPTLSASAPVRPTSLTMVIVTYTGAPTATIPFQTPIPTGVSGGLVPVVGGGGLSGGAIAGIVIGTLLGLLLLSLLCLYCCARALFDTLAAIFGFGKKRKHTHEETYIEEQHSSGGGRWYGQGRPARPPREKQSSGADKGMGIAAGLAALALAMGLRRKNDRRDDKSTTVSGSSYYYSDYTSSSSASSSDRQTRQTRQSTRR